MISRRLAFSASFYLSLGFSNTTIGAVNTIFAVGPYLAGVFLGGLVHRRLGVYRALVSTSFLTNVSVAATVLLVYAGNSEPLLAVLVTAQSIAAGMANAVFVAYLASLTDSRYTATQFAVFTALATLARSALTAPTGWVAEQTGWAGYFWLCTALGLIGLVILTAFKNLFQSRVASVG